MYDGLRIHFVRLDSFPLYASLGYHPLLTASRSPGRAATPPLARMKRFVGLGTRLDKCRSQTGCRRYRQGCTCIELCSGQPGSQISKKAEGTTIAERTSSVPIRTSGCKPGVNQ